MMKPRLNRSPVWLYFSKDYENNIARCMMCHHDFKVMPNHSTTNLLNHLRKNHKINPHYMGEQDSGGIPPPMDDGPHMEMEQIQQHGEENPYIWLYFDKINETTVSCRLCYDNKEIHLVPGKEMTTIVRHLANKHPQSHKQHFAEEPDLGQGSTERHEQIETAVDTHTKELQPMRQLPLKEEPGEENEVEVQVVQETRPPNPAPPHAQRPLFFPPHFKEMSHHATSHPIFYQNGLPPSQPTRNRAPSPSPSETTRTDSPPPEKKTKSCPGFGFDNDDEFKALGNLVEKELRSVSQKDPNLATKYQIAIQEELTKMKKEVLFKLQFT